MVHVPIDGIKSGDPLVLRGKSLQTCALILTAFTTSFVPRSSANHPP